MFVQKYRPLFYEELNKTGEVVYGKNDRVDEYGVFPKEAGNSKRN